MPQNPFPFDSSPPDHRLLLEVEDCTLDLYDEVKITVRLQRHDRPPETFAVVRLTGAGADYTASAVQEIAQAWLYSDRSAVLLACQQVQRRARRHAARYQRSQVGSPTEDGPDAA